MPRTRKRVSAEKEALEYLIKDLERKANQRIHMLEEDLKLDIAQQSANIDVIVAGLPTEIRNMTLRELRTSKKLENVAMENAAEPEAAGLRGKRRAGPKSKTLRATSDDGYATESTMPHSVRVSRRDSTKNADKKAKRSAQSAPRRSGSAHQRSRSSQKLAVDCKSLDRERTNLLKSATRCPSAYSKYKTPLHQPPADRFPPVTPKVGPNTPMNVLRRPRQGEMALSMQGSPLLISSIVQEDSANINVPLNNGNIVSLLPQPGLRLSLLPDFDAETMRQLKTLKGHIEKVIDRKKYLK